MTLKQVFARKSRLAALSLAAAAIVAISAAPGQDRRQDRFPDRRQDRDPNRTNVHCEVDGFGNRSNVRFDNTLDDTDRFCRKGDAIILNSPVLVARLCDFTWSIVTTSAGATVCVYGGVRELR